MPSTRTEIRSLALPGHAFHVVALDGNPVPTPTSVPVLVGHGRANQRYGHHDASGVCKPKPYRWDYTMW
jgi:hypothetical protein